MEWIKTIIYGIVEGITEWLPISSTGHMILVDEFIKLDVSKEFLDMFRFLGDVSGCHTVGSDLSCCINVLESAMAILQQGKRLY